MVTKETLLSLLKTAHYWLDDDKKNNPDIPEEVYLGAHLAIRALEKTIEIRVIDCDELENLYKNKIE